MVWNLPFIKILIQMCIHLHVPGKQPIMIVTKLISTLDYEDLLSITITTITITTLQTAVVGWKKLDWISMVKARSYSNSLVKEALIMCNERTVEVCYPWVAVNNSYVWNKYPLQQFYSDKCTHPISNFLCGRITSPTLGHLGDLTSWRWSNKQWAKLHYNEFGC